ncbi:ATP synthase subunit I [Brevibacillus sp. SYSU BS000544]|uniref:ATP synthase subunit I n=1 Tax=Brevibacillus sp. SYSU BS000544 TaxID=3416443 RepID=UPI003CE568BB
MQNFSAAMRLTFKYAFYCASFVMILWAVLPDHRLFLQSLLLGIAVSLINGAVLLAKTWRVGQVAENPSLRPKGTGMLQRLITVGFAVYLTVRLPDLFIISGALIGFFLIPLLSLLFVYRSLK